MGGKSEEWILLISAEFTTHHFARRHRRTSYEAFKTKAALFVLFCIGASISFVTCRCRLLASPGLALPPASCGPLPPSSPAPYLSPALFPPAAFFHPGALCTWRGWTQYSYQQNDFCRKQKVFCLFHFILEEALCIFLFLSLFTLPNEFSGKNKSDIVLCRSNCVTDAR